MAHIVLVVVVPCLPADGRPDGELDTRSEKHTEASSSLTVCY